MSAVRRIIHPRRRYVFLAGAAAVAVCATVFGIQLASAGGATRSLTVPGSAPVGTSTISGNEKLKTTVVSSGAANSSGSGFLPVDAPFTFTCSGKPTCTFTDEGVVQVSDNGDSWALCFVVDSSFVCPYIGILPNDGFVTTESISQTFTGLASGRHTVQTKAFFDSPSTVHGYDLKYRSYTP
jgi:hypothetical protein